MSMFDDVLGLGRSSVTESMMEDTLEPEIAGMTLEEAADIDEDPMDFMLRVAYENEMNMMKLDAAIVAEEYIYLRENGQEMVTEAGKIESIISKFKETVQRLWGKIQSFFKSVMNKLDSALRLDDRFLKKYEEKALRGGSALVKGQDSLMDLDKIGKRATGLLDAIGKVGNNIYKEFSKDNHPDEKKVMDQVNNWIHIKVVNTVEGDNAKELMKALIEGYKPGEDAKPHSVSAKKAIDAFKASKDVKADVKSAYNKNKEAINGHLKTAKTMESAAKKFKVLPTEQSKAIHGTVKILNKLGSTLTLINRTYIKIINMSRSMCKAVIIGSAAKVAGEPKDTKNESASMIESFDLL